MKLTPEVEHFLEKTNKHYCKALRIKDTYLIYNKNLEEIGFIDSEIRKLRKYVLGESWVKGNLDQIPQYHIIYLNVEATDYLWQVIETLAHELLHIKEQDLKHGLPFQNKVNDIILKNTFF